jgi:hypothetical protein
MPSFEDLLSLGHSHSHKHLYTFLGKVAILRPDDEAHFVKGDNDHPMLPNVAGLYKLRDPELWSMELTSAESRPLINPFASLALARRASQPVAGNAPSLRTAILQFMTTPHPLQTLASHSAYGHDGAVSRFHNPANYMQAISRILHLAPMM